MRRKIKVYPQAPIRAMVLTPYGDRFFWEYCCGFPEDFCVDAGSSSFHSPVTSPWTISTRVNNFSTGLVIVKVRLWDRDIFNSNDPFCIGSGQFDGTGPSVSDLQRVDSTSNITNDHGEASCHFSIHFRGEPQRQVTRHRRLKGRDAVGINNVLKKPLCACAISLSLIALVGCGTIVPPTSSPSVPLFLPSKTPNISEVRTPSITATPITGASIPVPTRALTIAATQSARAPKPEIISFTVSPTTTNALGQNISLEWQAKGEKAEVCGLVETTLTDCHPLALSGRTTYAATSVSANFPELILRVTAGEDAAVASIPVMLCVDSTRWFFASSPTRCAGPANIARGAAQNFEHGVMIWIPKPDRFFVFYADAKQTFDMVSAPYNFKPGASPNNRVGSSPTGLIEPVSGFGQLWRGEIVGTDNVRQRLGWATAPEFEFDSAYQCVVSAGRLWQCYLRDARGQILALGPDSSAGVNLLWSVVPGK